MPLAEPTLPTKELTYTEACWGLIERVVASPQLKRAARMREFLLYVGHRSLKDGCDQIHEQEIGSEVFGRPAGYDTGMDNIVRVNASELRKRIEDYFETDGAAEALVLDIPRGSYKPVFRPRVIQPNIVAEAGPAAESTPHEPSAPPLSVQTSQPAGRGMLTAAAAAILALAAGCCILAIQNHSLRKSLHPWELTPTVSSFWSGFLGARPNTDVILADTSFALIEDITRKQIPLTEYLSRDYLRETQSLDLSQDRRDDLAMIMKRNNGSLGDFRAAQRVLALDPLGKTIHLFSARDFTPALLKQDNVILVGARKSNPWDDLLADSMNFTAEYDSDKLTDYIRNRKPAAGEQQTYAPAALPPGSGYSVAAYLPNPQQTGKVLILAGTDSAATEGAGEFLTSEDQLARFKKMLHVTSLPYFEVLLQTSHLNGTPIDAKIVAYRVYSAPR